MDFLILRLTEIARIEKWLDIDFSHKDKGLCCQRDVRGGEDPREIEMTRRETTSPEPRQTRHRLVMTSPVDAVSDVNNDMYCPT